MASTTVSACAAAGSGPMRSIDRIGPYDRRPSGGYRAASTARAASAALSTSGTITPDAPASSARPMGVGSLASTRTRPTDAPPASMAVSDANRPA